MAKNNRAASGDSNGTRTVIAVRFSALGDVAMTIPVLYSACMCHPATQFVMVTRKAFTGIFVNKPANLTVVGVDLADKRYNGPLGMRRLIADLADKYRPGTFVDLHDVLRTKLMRLFCRLRGIRVASIDKGRAAKRALTRQSGKKMQPLASSTERYLDTFARAGIAVDLRFQSIFGPGRKGDPALYSAVAPAERPSGEKWVGIAPFAAHEGKIYPPEKMEQVVDMLSNRGDTRIFIFGGGGREKEIAEAWESKYPAVTSLCGKRLGFGVELSLLSHLDAVVTMDSGNMHLASVAGATTVSVWGATHPYCGFTGWRQSPDTMVQTQLPCRPCSVFGNRPCLRGDLACLNTIAPSQIYAKVAEIIDAGTQ